MIRRSFGSLLAPSGLSGSAAPVSGSTRMERAVEPGRVAGGAEVLAAQRAALGASAASACRRRRPADRRTGSCGRAELAVVDVVEARAVAAGHVERAVGAEREVADRVARELLAPVLDQHLLGARHALPLASRRDSRPLTTQPSVGRRRAGSGSRRRCQCPTAAPSRRSRRRRCRARRRTGLAGKLGSSARPSRPRSQKLWTFVRRSAKTVARGVAEAVEDLDEAALLGDEDPAVGREAHGGRLSQPGETRRVLEARAAGRASRCGRSGRCRIRTRRRSRHTRGSGRACRGSGRLPAPTRSWCQCRCRRPDAAWRSRTRSTCRTGTSTGSACRRRSRARAGWPPCR